ncbi:ATP-binding protein [Neotabrizicola sp. sgz301269]|uniref:sensor histidine kinase n=1 Tax=Neotabrizicola sp. sgz301269 TaxID=3276282 RepID=UPI00376FEA12
MQKTTKTVLILLGLGMLMIAVWQTHRLALQTALETDRARVETALRMAVNAVEGDLARYEAMPQLLADLDEIQLMVTRPDDPVRRAGINRLLEEQSSKLLASDIYIMRPDGETIAASNHRRIDSFIGHNFRYRPYFQEAVQGGQGRFYGVGTTSGVRGYFFSSPIYDHAGRIGGVIAVKVGVDRIEESWRGGEYSIFVTDPEGIVFLSSDPELLYGSLYPLTPDRLARTETNRRYSDLPLHELTFRSDVLAGVEIARLAAAGGAEREFIVQHQNMAEAGWTVNVLLDSGSARAEARVIAVATILLLCVAGFAAVMVLQRRARIAERIRLQAESNADLERRVEERTAALEREVAERRATEAELRAAQANLVRVGKLAALGQMSAALSHEINQPLAAARNYADSAAILIDRGDTARARENMGLILSLIDRMTAIGRHLRNAARKPNDRLEPVSLAQLLPETQIILAGRLASAKAVLEIDLPPGLPAMKAGATRLQQVLVNLIANAADAVEGREDRRITLSARVVGNRVALSIRDRGPGIPDAIADRIFDPFFTTKGVGAGLGLGLSICYNIIRDFDGEIVAHSAKPGTEFIVTVPAWPAVEVAA